MAGTVAVRRLASAADPVTFRLALAPRLRRIAEQIIAAT